MMQIESSGAVLLSENITDVFAWRGCRLRANINHALNGAKSQITRPVLRRRNFLLNIETDHRNTGASDLASRGSIAMGASLLSDYRFARSAGESESASSWWVGVL